MTRSYWFVLAFAGGLSAGFGAAQAAAQPVAAAADGGGASGPGAEALIGAMLGALLLLAALTVSLGLAPRGRPIRSLTAGLFLVAAAVFVAAQAGVASAWAERRLFEPPLALGLLVMAAGVHMMATLAAARSGAVMAGLSLAVAAFGCVAAGAAWAGAALGQTVVFAGAGGCIAVAMIGALGAAGRGDVAGGVSLPGVLAMAAGAALIAWRSLAGLDPWPVPLPALGALTLGALIVGFATLAAARAGAPRRGAGLEAGAGAAGEALALLEGADIGLWSWSARGDRVGMSAPLRRMLGEDDAEPAAEVAWRARIAPEDTSLYEEALRGGREPQAGPFDIRLRVAAEDGTVRPLRFRGVRALNAEDGALERVAAIVEPAPREAEDGPAADAAPVPEMQAELIPPQDESGAEADPLTGLALRGRLFEEMRASGSAGGGVLVFGLDRFKAVNQALGFAGGDGLLVEIARRLREAVAEHGFVARLGGDAFGVFAPGDHSPEELAEAAEDLRKRLAGAVLINDQEVIPSVSVGVAARTPDETFETCLAQAEQAMYAAKAEGGGRVVAYSEKAGAQAQATLPLETDLRRALERGEIEVHYQPVIRLSDGAAAGFEALVRWRHSQRGLIAPSEFIEFAEKTDLIGPITRAVLTQAAEDLAWWRKETKAEGIFVSVNIDSRQVLNPHLETAVSEAIFAYGLPPNALRIEVTESQIMADPETAAAVLRRLRDAGAGLSLDDFGTGFSALAYLHQFEFDYLKIDRSFVIGMDTDPTAVKIARAIIDLAHDLSMKVIAEGAETEASARRLRAMGCEYAQGFIFGAAMTAREACSFVSSYARAAE